MKALVFQGPGRSSWEERPRPKVQQANDAIVRITRTSICGTDLQILKGAVPSVSPGRVLGHEGVGIVEELGAAVVGLRTGDKVLLSCVTSCGTCSFCRRGMCSHCRSGGWLLGNTIDGTQAEYVRVPYAETSLHRLPVQADEEAMVLLSDLFPTGFECGVLNGGVKPADTVAIVGAGPIGLAALLTAQFYSPAEVVVIDGDQKRLDFAICQAILAPGGRVANVGVHGKRDKLRLERQWDRNITLATQLVDAVTTPLLMKMVLSGRLEPAKLVTHHFDLADVGSAYTTFANAAGEGALKVILRND